MVIRTFCDITKYIQDDQSVESYKSEITGRTTTKIITKKTFANKIFSIRTTVILWRYCFDYCRDRRFVSMTNSQNRVGCFRRSFIPKPNRLEPCRFLNILYKMIFVWYENISIFCCLNTQTVWSRTSGLLIWFIYIYVWV